MAFFPMTPTTAVSVSSTPAATALPEGGPSGAYRVLRIRNRSGATDNTDDVWVQLGDSAVEAAIPSAGASTGGFSITAGSGEYLEVPHGVTHIALISSGAATPTVEITLGKLRT